MSYQIKLNVFEGPYDLLLFLIRKGEIDIYDIPIARITREYLEYVELMQSLNLEIAGEFLVMASTLMRIKVRMLLPVYAGEDEEFEDPRHELVQNLLEYQKFKYASEKLEALESQRRNVFIRSNQEKDFQDEMYDEDYELQMNIYELIVAYNHLITKEKKETFHVVERDPVTIEQQMDEILELLGSEKRISFRQHLMRYTDAIIIIINFLAILELAKRKLITIKQAQPYKDIWIYKRSIS
ncbi:segregation and condensation protein A [candidate division KSB1 bacterium]